MGGRNRTVTRAQSRCSACRKRPPTPDGAGLCKNCWAVRAQIMIVCSTIITLRKLEEPAWLKLLLVILSPTGLVALILGWLLRQAIRRLRATEQKLESTKGPQGHPGEPKP